MKFLDLLCSHKGLFLHHANEFLLIHQTCAPRSTRLVLLGLPPRLPFSSFPGHTCFLEMYPNVDFGKLISLLFAFSSVYYYLLSTSLALSRFYTSY